MSNQTVSKEYLARLMSGDHANRPVVIVKGKAAPKKCGESYYFTTPGGKIVHHPNAYGYPVVYHASTICTNVGDQWLASARNRAEYHVADGIRAVLMMGRLIRVGTVRVIPGWMKKGERVYVAIRGKRSYHMARNLALGKFDRAAAEAVAAEAKAMWAKQGDASALGRENARIERIFRRDLAATRVSLLDSRKAGNCIEGTLTFAERKLGLSRAEILAAGYLFSVPASKVIAVANGQTAQAMRAVRVAWQRETTVSI